MRFTARGRTVAQRELYVPEMLREEMAHVMGDPRWRDPRNSLGDLRRSLHALPDDCRPGALCLSGGGIRSATFCLGVLQWLAGQRKLQRFNYLSTVSGGGYIGSWLVNSLRNASQPGGSGTDDWLNRLASGAGQTHAARGQGGAGDDDNSSDPVAALRAYSNFLSPTGGLSGDAFTLAAIFVRNLLLNALVWFPMLAALVLLPRLYIAVLAASDGWPDGVQWLMLGVSLLAVVVAIAYIVSDLPPARQAAANAPRPPQGNHINRACSLPIVAAALVLSLAAVCNGHLQDMPRWQPPVAGVLVYVIGIALGTRLRVWRGLPPRPANWIAAGAVLAVGALGGMLTWQALIHLGADGFRSTASPWQQLMYASFTVPAVVAVFWLAMSLYAGLVSRPTGEPEREWWARATAAWLQFSLGWLAVFGLVVWLPVPILDRLGASASPALQLGVGGGLLGVVTSLFGYWSKNGGAVRQQAAGFIRLTGLKVLDAMAGLVVVAIVLALSLGWNAVLHRCHDWGWAQAAFCRTDLPAQTAFLREQLQWQAQAELLDRAAQAASGAPAADPVVAGAAGWSGDGSSAAAAAFVHVLLNADWLLPLVAAAALFGFASLLALSMSTNAFSLHGMYGNRLVRAFLGTGRAQRNPHPLTDIDPRDNAGLDAFKVPLTGSDQRPRLFPVVNIALNLVRPSRSRQDWQQRKAAPFIATPLHSGAAVLGYRDTGQYAGGMTLGRAMTISGAAASPNMGYHSSPLVTLVMSLFNVRLGWWSPNPGQAGGSRWKEDLPFSGLRIRLAEATGSTGADDPFVYLSDGGHFDNTGIYEMVRRRCGLIVAVDATCDGEFKWTDLLDTVRKVRVDLGIPIDLPSELPGPGRDTGSLRHIEARIRYSVRDGNPPEQDGLLIVLKPRVLPQQDPPELAAYAAASAREGSTAADPARFPHQSTADQFYDEQQFESYRLLGYLTAADAFAPKARGLKPRRLKPRAAGSTVSGSPRTAGGMPADDLSNAALQGAAAPGLSPGGLGQLVQQAGVRAAMATALTVGGTLGVAGTVALAPAEVGFSEPARQLIREGLPLRVEGDGLKLNADDRRLLQDGLGLVVNAQAVQDSAARLGQAALAVEAAASRLQAPPLNRPAPAAFVPDELLRAELSQVRLAVLGLSTRISRTVPASASASASATSTDDLASALAGLQARLAAAERLLLTDPQLPDALKDLKAAVEKIQPRRNVRGQ